MFISFEGLDGSGKTTQIRRLAASLRASGDDVLVIREPGGTPLGEAVRMLLLAPEGEITPRAELMLFAAARAQLVEQVIRPALDAGQIVLADRYIDSTTAYQGAGRGLLSYDEAAAFHALVTGALLPDLTLWVDISPENAERRRASGRPDRIEAAGTAFFECVREGYHQLALRHPERIVRLDGDQPIPALEEQVRRLVAARRAA